MVGGGGGCGWVTLGGGCRWWCWVIFFGDGGWWWVVVVGDNEVCQCFELYNIILILCILRYKKHYELISVSAQS